MRHLHTLFLVLTAHAVHVAIGHSPVEERDAPEHSLIEARATTLSTEDVDVSLMMPFQPWPGFFEGKTTFSSRSLLKRSPEGVGICRAHSRYIQRERRHLGHYKQVKAWCQTEDPTRRRYLVDCKQKGFYPWTDIEANGLFGRCREGTMCMAFQGASPYDGEPATDINCVDLATIREYAVDATRLQSTEVCSVNYVNKDSEKHTVKMALETNVFDSSKTQQIAPANIYYKLDGKRFGAGRAHDATVGSGIVEVVYGSKLQACVDGMPGQILWAVVGMTALLFLDHGGKS